MAVSSLKSHPSSSGLFPTLPSKPLRPTSCLLAPTLREGNRQTTSQNEVTLVRDELRELKSLISDYGFTAQSWIRARTVLNQKRRRWLQAILHEAGLDGAYCRSGQVSGPNGDWDEALHNVWHKVIV